MRHFILAGLLFAPLNVAAEEAPWVALSGTQIMDVLTGRVLDYPTAWQDFRASGRTLYHAGRDTWGYWAVRGNQYCSMWPPSDLWACYDLEQRGTSLRFIGAAGDVTQAVLRDESG